MFCKHVMLYIVLNMIACVQSRCVTETTFSLGIDSNEAHLPKYSMRCSVTVPAGTTSVVDFMRNALDKANDTQSLHFVDSRLTRVPARAFSHLPDLHVLNLKQAGVRSLSPSALHGLSNLRILFLNNNSISQLPQRVFANLNQLHTLHLSHNNLSSIDVTVFHGLTKLQSLHLDNNQIKSINNSAPRTQPVYENRNRLTFWRDPTAYMLYVHNQTSSYILKRSDDETDSKRTKDSSIFMHAPWMHMLQVGVETINHLKPYIFNTTQELLEVWLNHNEIRVIHEDSFANLTDLIFLNLGHNNIETISTGTFRDLSSLMYLDLSYNRLAQLEYGLFTGLTQLEILNLRGNHIKHLQANVLFPMAAIRLINLSDNFIHSFDATKIVLYFRNIQEININNNKLSCDWLTETLYLFNKSSITLSPGISYKTTNVQGIQCSPTFI